MPKKGFKYNKKKKKDWIFTTPRKAAMAKAQRVHVILINIGKKYRDKEAHKFPR